MLMTQHPNTFVLSHKLPMNYGPFKLDCYAETYFYCAQKHISLVAKIAQPCRMQELKILPRSPMGENFAICKLHFFFPITNYM